ncbi:unnamed protein product, partial [Ectocarpus fasciculatus]
MKPTTLRPPSASTILAGLTNTGGGGGVVPPLVMSLDFRLRHRPHLRHFHGDGCEATNSFIDNVRDAIVDKSREVGDAICDAIGMGKHDEITLYKRKGWPVITGPHGHTITERMWKELDARQTGRSSPTL